MASVSRLLLLCVAILLTPSIVLAADTFYKFSKDGVKPCSNHLWGNDCQSLEKRAEIQKTKYQHAEQNREPSASADEPKTAEEYIRQTAWKNMPDKFRLNRAEEKMLGELAPETSNIPLPLLKLLLTPEYETPEQLREDYENYMAWNDARDAIVTKGSKNMYRFIGGGDPIKQVANIKPGGNKAVAHNETIGRSNLSKIKPVPDKDVMFLYFFNSHCPFCNKMTPVIKSFLSEHPSVAMVAYVRDESMGDSQAYLDKHNLDVPLAEPTQEVFDRFNVSQTSYPRLVILDKKTGEFVQIKGYYPVTELLKALKILSIQRDKNA